MPEVGEFGLVHGSGWVGAGIRLVTRSDVAHAFVYVGHGLIVEAEASGAVLSPVHKYKQVLWSGSELTEGRGAAIARQARSLLGTPYSFLGVAALGIALITDTHVPRWAQRRLDDDGDLFCSQLVDVAYRNAGVQLFDDGRWPGAVSPASLESLILRGGD